MLDSTYCIPMVNITGQHFATTTATSARGNGCFDLRSFDLNQTNTAVPTALGQLNYIKSGAPVPPSGSASRGMSISNHNVIDVDYKTVLDGVAVGALRTTPADPHVPSLCTDTGASIARSVDILSWFDLLSVCRLRPAILAGPFDDPIVKLPVYRTRLGQAFPNPASVGTRIPFVNGNKGALVRLDVFDVTGRLVRTLVNRSLPAGLHEASWDGKTDRGQIAASGLYFYRMRAGAFVEVRKIILTR